MFFQPEKVELKNIRTMFDFSSGNSLNCPDKICLNLLFSFEFILYFNNNKKLNIFFVEN